MYIYRKSDLTILSGIQDESQFESVYENCLKNNYGGTLESYGTINVNFNKFHLERNELGEVVAVEDILTVAEQRQAIINQLEQLDKIVDRQSERIYEDTNTTPKYQLVIDTILQKEWLRLQLQELV
jgi:hypothetical protein